MSSKEQIWDIARKRYNLSEAHVIKAKRLGLNPKNFSRYGMPSKKQRWKKPLPKFIDDLYAKRFKGKKFTKIKARPFLDVLHDDIQELLKLNYRWVIRGAYPKGMTKNGFCETYCKKYKIVTFLTKKTKGHSVILKLNKAEYLILGKKENMELLKANNLFPPPYCISETPLVIDSKRYTINEKGQLLILEKSE